MNGQLALAGFAAGLLVAVLTAPVGVSGAVFLLPIQLDVLRVPSPAVTPTNLLFNVVGTPGSLWRYHRQGQWGGPLVGRLVRATVPGVLVGALIRVYLVPGVEVFRLLGALVLLPLGVWLCGPWQRRRPDRPTPALSDRWVSVIALVVGVVGGLYGIGGGSLLGPILVGAGFPLAAVAPAALAATFVTSLAGVAAYAVLAWTTADPVGPYWLLGLSCGVGGLVGGYLGAWLQPKVPERGLRRLLGAVAVVVAVGYVARFPR